MKMLAGILVLACVSALATAQQSQAAVEVPEEKVPTSEEADVASAEVAETDIAEALNSMLIKLQNVLAETDPLHIPFLPMINGQDISIALTELEFTGLRNVILPTIPDIIGQNDGRVTIDVSFPLLTIFSGHYIAGGHINNLPFVGEDSMTSEVRNMSVQLSYEKSSRVNYCATPNTTDFNLTVDVILVNFNELNPGQDTGDVINSMMSNIGDDIMKIITNLFNGKLYPAFDQFVVKLINTALNSQTLYDCEPAFNGTISPEEYDEIVQMFEIGQQDGGDDFTYLVENFLTNLKFGGATLNEVAEKLLTDLHGLF